MTDRSGSGDEIQRCSGRWKEQPAASPEALRLTRRGFLRSSAQLALGAAALPLIGCDQPSRATPNPTGATPAAPDNQLVLHSPEDRSYVEELVTAFTRETGLAARVPPLGGSGSVARSLRSERRESQVTGGVVYGGGPVLFHWLDLQDLLATEPIGHGQASLPFPVPAHWLVADLMAFSFVGRRFAASELQSIEQLPERDATLILPDPTLWDYGTLLVLSVLQWHQPDGWAFWRAVHQKPVVLAFGRANLVSALRAQAQAVALVPHHLAQWVAAQVPDAWIAWPAEVPVLPNPAARVLGAPRPEEATQLLAWLGSEGAHQVMLSRGRLPVGCQSEHPLCDQARSVQQHALPLDIAQAYQGYNLVREEWPRRVQQA